jgi:hypothetical protein
MIIAIMQPYLFPYIGYWQLINAVDKFVIFDDVNFINKGSINRNKILVQNKTHQFTLELVGASQNKLINQIQIGNNSNKILKTIELNYKRSPYFKNVFPLIEEIFNQKEKNLAKFIGYSLKKISYYLEIDVGFIYSSDIEKDNNLRNQDKIINICQMLNATHYINPINGKELYDKELFLKKDFELNFIQTKPFKYRQFNSKFISSLSIIDIMMFNNIDNIKSLLNFYELVE